MNVHSLSHVQWGKVMKGCKNQNLLFALHLFWMKANQSPPPPHTQSLLSALCVPGLCAQEALTGRKTDRERETEHLEDGGETDCFVITLKHHCNLLWCFYATLSRTLPEFDCARTKAWQWTLHTYTYTCPLLNPDTNRHYPDAAAASEINHGLSTSLPLSLSLVVCLCFPLSTSLSVFSGMTNNSTFVSTSE